MKQFCPLPRRFAVIQMDPVGMVRHFDDPIALAAARSLEPKKYLVYLRMPLDLPTPTNPWFRYEVCPIGTTLRPEDDEQGITSDMVIPIYPNTSHPRGRLPIHTETPFPFPNCYYWIKNRCNVRIRRKAVRYDDTRAVILGIGEDMDLEGMFLEDYERIYATQRLKLEAAMGVLLDDVSRTHECVQDCTDALPLDSNIVLIDPAGPGDVTLTTADLNHRHEDFSDTSSRSSSHDATRPDECDPISNILNLEIFSCDMDDTVELLPLVDLWFELTDHLSADSIPNPAGFCEEHHRIMQIIHDARERAPSIRMPFIDDGVSIDYDALSSIYEGFSESRTIKEKLFGRRRPRSIPRHSLMATTRASVLFRMWRGMGREMRRLFKHPAPWSMHPPCLPFWS
ncbi:hypothetical protein C8Q78DRAFT_1040799 [Trametes maxima]|nr:hypothetical protein C8Q78DRAFT_1040799 [Trametes maxima]